MLSSIRPATVSLLIGSLAGCGQPDGVARPQIAYCTQLYQLYFHYHPIITYAHNGQRAKAELALHACEQGNYAAGIRELTVLLERDRVAVPPPPPSGDGRDDPRSAAAAHRSMRW